MQHVILTTLSHQPLSKTKSTTGTMDRQAVFASTRRQHAIAVYQQLDLVTCIPHTQRR
jgi:hypothetical protein